MAGSAVWKEAVQMSLYLNPGSEGFEEVLRTEYVDKTGLIGLTNRTIGTKQKLVCVSRPRRFGKSFAAQMLSAYYDRSCDSHALFDGLMVSQLPDYEMRINQITNHHFKWWSDKPYKGDCVAALKGRSRKPVTWLPLERVNRSLS